MKRAFVGLRALIYASGFIAIWGWFVLSAVRADQAAGRVLAEGLIPRTAGYALVVAGGLLALTCAGFFVVKGEGTPAPFDAPRRFVASGPYRFVRNPMYVGAISLLVGLALVFGAPSVLLVAATAFVFASFFVVLFEEPSLSRQFGESYASYRRATNRWIPRAPRRA